MAVTAFHAVNSGSNPLGDANRKLKAHHSTSIFRGMWCVFLYQYSPLLSPYPPSSRSSFQALCHYLP